jgi:hypothetical protein
MPPLASDLRKQLENTIVAAREQAEVAAAAALRLWAVYASEPHASFNDAKKEFRNRLRARGRQAGDVLHGDDTQDIEQLIEQLAYEHWHRMLFARFLAENGLLVHPSGSPVTLAECEELAAEADPPVANGFVLAAQFASAMLPQIFRTDDVLLEVEFAPEYRLALEQLLEALPAETFTADDSLGWCYQFWQTKRKKEVNDSGEKIDGHTLPAVTQLFTEHYMVQFLLHNTIGAWWCAKNGVSGPPGGAGVPAGQSPVEMEYLRWSDDGRPAAGAFEGWPQTLKEFTMLDPCCGSGHFLVATFNLLVPLRMHDEGLTAKDACDAVLKDNIHGLELDQRCVQIAAFALALAAWKYPHAGGYRELPQVDLACSGQAVSGKKDRWLALAAGDDTLAEQITLLYDVFYDAPHLGSLIDPIAVGGPLFREIYADLHPRLARRLAKFIGDAEQSAMTVAAQGIAKAAELLANRYTLVITNVPYLGRGKQAKVLKKYIESHFAIAKADLATAFVLRCLQLCTEGGSSALVTPQNWLFLASYKKLRETLLKTLTWNTVARLGPRAFETISGEVVNVALLAISASKPASDHAMAGMDVADAKTSIEKAERLTDCVPTPFQMVEQAGQLKNPESKVILSQIANGVRLGDIAFVSEGLHTGDYPRFGRKHWELPLPALGWSRQQGGTGEEDGAGGCEHILFWEDGKGELIEFVKDRLGTETTSMWIKGEDVWGKCGIAIGTMNELKHSYYTGSLFTHGIVAVVPFDVYNLPPLWCYIESETFSRDVRQLDQKVSVARASFENVQLDLAYWYTVAAEKYPGGLPEPYSDDPTQWLFKGNILNSTEPMQVAVARLLGYRWPDQPKEADAVDALADADGIVCLPPILTEAAAADRVRELLRTAYGANWTEGREGQLIAATGCNSGTNLAEWLRDKFFEQHCRLFHNRPFIWHVWDGRKDGFSALVNYHKLDAKALDTLIYSYLGEWIKIQEGDAKAQKVGADARLAAAQTLQDKLKLIANGEAPYDIFVRWKPLYEQAMGWHPDLNNGVRMNIRPFVEADILRKKPNVNWKKDRGNEPTRPKADYPWFWDGDDFTGERVNDVHLTLAEKDAARKAAAQKP